MLLTCNLPRPPRSSPASAATRASALAAAMAMVISLGLPQTAQAQQKVLPAQSEIGFVSRQMGVPVEGKFRKWTAEVSFDPRKPEAGHIAFAIDTASATP